MKPLITESDFVLNPASSFDSRIPLFNLSNSEKYKTERGCMNYGAFLAVKRANEIASPIIRSLVAHFHAKTEQEKSDAYNELRILSEQYLDN